MSWKALISLPLAVCVIVSSACATARPRFELNYPQPTRGEVVTSNVTIIDEAGQFELRAGEVWRPPFDQGPDCVLNPDASLPDAGVVSGARRVRVHVPGRREALYGLLSLCGAPPDATGPATRNYQIESPQSYVDATNGGRVSVVFEPHQGQWAYGEPKSWILWLAQAPFEAPRGGVRFTTARIEAMKQPEVVAQSGGEDDVGLILALAFGIPALVGLLLYLVIEEA